MTAGKGSERLVGKQTVRIGIIGAGGIVRTRHMPELSRIPDVEVVAVCNRSRASSEQFAKEFGIPEVFDRWEDLIAASGIDAVLIGTWPYMHRTLSVAALDAGKHVFCQARMAMNYEDARAMYLRARRSDRVSMICPAAPERDPQVRKLLKDGYVGKVYAAALWACNDIYADPDAPFSWRQDPELSGLNTLSLGIHAENMRRCVGDTRSLCAHGKTFIADRAHPATGQRRRVGVFDTLMISSETEDCALVQYTFSGITRFSGHDRAEIFGSEGTITYDLETDEIRGARKGDRALRPIPTEAFDKRTIEQDFIDAIREGREGHPDFYDGLKYMEFTEAVYRSVETGKRIDLPFEKL